MSNIYQYGSGDNVGGDKVGRDKIETQINTSQDLEQAAKDISAILRQLSTDYPEANPKDLAGKALEQIDENSALKTRLIKGLKAGSFAALEKMIDHPVARFFIESAKEVLKS
jgi:uncharacterized protein YPO0396